MQADLSPAAQLDGELCRLIQQVALRDEAALSTLYMRLSRTIYAFSLRRLCEPEAAEEVVVETMYEVWKNASRFAGRSRVTTWVLGIARHKSLDKLRMRGNDMAEPMGDEADGVADSSPSVYEMIAEKQRDDQVALCLEALPDAQRECMYLVFYEDAPLAEIAQLQACPENTVKTRLFHARRKMKECLEKQVWQALKPPHSSTWEMA